MIQRNSDNRSKNARSLASSLTAIHAGEEIRTRNISDQVTSSSSSRDPIDMIFKQLSNYSIEREREREARRTRKMSIIEIIFEKKEF